MRGDNSKCNAITNQSLYAVKYGFQARRGTSQSILYGAPYQGLGFFSSTFHHPQDLGTPWGLYLFQGARIATITPRLSFNYEWKFGMSGGWHHYSYPDNPANDIIGSPLNAYINTTFYINYIISKHWGVSAGISATHYSNGNTRTPNRGINVLSGTIGMRYYFNRDFDRYFSPRNIITRPPFMRSMSYEIMGYASWKDAILDTSNTPVENPYLNKKLLVAGFSFSPMYVLGRKVRVGSSRTVLRTYPLRHKIRTGGSARPYGIGPVRQGRFRDALFHYYRVARLRHNRGCRQYASDISDNSPPFRSIFAFLLLYRI